MFVDLDTSVVDCSHNDISVFGQSGNGGIVAFQDYLVPIAAPSSFLIQHNRIKAAGIYEDGIWLNDFGTVFGNGKTTDFVVSNNEITIGPTETGPADAAIVIAFAEGAIISNNRILGNGVFGIAVSGDSQAMVKANNVERVTTDAAPIYLMTNLWWAPDIVVPTTDSTVVGFGNETNVYADPEGYGNILVGVNNIQGNPPGPAVRDAMKRKMALIKSIRRP